MNRTLTITLNLTDDPSILPYALEIVKEGISNAFLATEFEKAELDGTLLISKDGEASKDVKQLQQYMNILQQLRAEQ